MTPYHAGLIHRLRRHGFERFLDRPNIFTGPHDASLHREAADALATLAVERDALQERVDELEAAQEDSK